MPMPDFSKSPPELVARFDSIALRYPDVPRRLSFGHPCLYVGGNMVTGLHGAHWFVRLGQDALAEAFALPGAAPFEVMPGRPMTGYAVLPAAIVKDDRLIGEWVERAIDFGATLPPKTPKPKGAKVAKAPKAAPG